MGCHMFYRTLVRLLLLTSVGSARPAAPHSVSVYATSPAFKIKGVIYESSEL